MSPFAFQSKLSALLKIYRSPFVCLPPDVEMKRENPYHPSAPQPRSHTFHRCPREKAALKVRDEEEGSTARSASVVEEAKPEPAMVETAAAQVIQ